MGRQAGRQAVAGSGRQADRQAGRQAGRQVGGQAGREAGRRAGRQLLECDATTHCLGLGRPGVRTPVPGVRTPRQVRGLHRPALVHVCTRGEELAWVLCTGYVFKKSKNTRRYNMSEVQNE